MTPLRQRMIDELRLRNYADNTVERYLNAVKNFARHFHKSPDRLGREQIREYLLHLVKDRNAAPNTVQIHRAALRFLYVKTLSRQWFDEQVARTRRRPGLPTVLSAEEITRISAPFRCCSAMRIFKRPPSICAFPQKECRPLPARSTRWR